MEKGFGVKYEFVVEGETRWYSHFGLLNSLFRAKPALLQYRESMQSDDHLFLKAKSQAKMEKLLNSLGSVTFWTQLELIAELLRPLTIEIGVVERRGTGISDVAQSFGRYWAFLEKQRRESFQRFSRFPGLLDDLLERWRWRMNVYYEIDLLILSIALDPRCRFSFLSEHVSPKMVFNILERFVLTRARDIFFEVSVSTGGSSSAEVNADAFVHV
jgi:hypothetical protein